MIMNVNRVQLLNLVLIKYISSFGVE